MFFALSFILTTYLLLYYIISKLIHIFMSNTIINKHSSVITEGKPKLPTPEQLEYGEIAVNYSEGNETISIKNSANNIIEFKSKNYFEKIIEENELVISTSLNELNNNIINKSEIGHTHLSSEITDSVSQLSGITEHTSEVVQGKVINEIREVIKENELVTSTVLNDVYDKIDINKSSLQFFKENLNNVSESVSLKEDKIPIQNIQNTNINVTINKNTLYILDLIQNANFIFNTTEENDYLNEYYIILNITTPYTLSFPSNIKWVKNLELEDNKTYYIVISQNIAMWVAINN